MSIINTTTLLIPTLGEHVSDFYVRMSDTTTNGESNGLKEQQ